MFFAIPLLSSLAVTHAFIPPTPGPIAVADIVKADLGWIILFGAMVGLPTTIIAGVLFGKFISNKIHVEVPDLEIEKPESANSTMDPNIFLVLALILLPLVMILLNTVANSMYAIDGQEKEQWLQWVSFLGHPIVALLLSLIHI